MKTLKLGNGNIPASAISLGCMRMHELTVKEASELIGAALDEGIDFFDHADIYGAGASETLFAKALDMRHAIRGKFILQSKCGILHPNKPEVYYDQSREHILSSVDGILRRLNTEYLDVLLLHRPDALMEPEEVAEAFDTLLRQGKVRHFGVSNMNPVQIDLLQKHVKQKLIIDQLQLSLTNTGMIDNGLNVNTKFENAVDRDGSILEYCRLKDITIQAWSPFQYGWFEGVFIGSGKFVELNRELNKLAEQYGVTDTAIATAWILRHPAKIQVIVGTTKPQRLKEICKACDVALTRTEWYDLYKAAGNRLP